MDLSLSINGTAIPAPSSFKIERYNITRGTRLADASMAMELIAKKKKFTLKYNVISSTELNQIIALVDSALFFTFEYSGKDNGSTTVYSGDLPAELLVTGDEEWYYQNFQLDLIEQ